MGVIRQTTGLGEKLKAALDAKRMQTQVGWLDGAKYEDGTPVAYVAAIQEFGSAEKGNPPRSFMRTTVSEKSEEWTKLLESGARAVINGNATIEQVMAGLGMAAEGDIRKKISQIQAPPLKKSTIASRKRKLANNKKVGNLTKPLVETSLMINSLTSTTEAK